MNERYFAAFRAHRILFIAPVLIAAAIAAYSAISAPKMYRSGATLWSDAPGASTSSIFGAQPPAAQDQQLLVELLTTRYFDSAVARNSPLGNYVQTHPASGGLLASLRGKKTYDDRVAAALGPSRVIAVARGQHVLEVSYDAETPTLARSTLQAIISEFRKQRGALRQDALDAAAKQVDSASKVLATARKNLDAYVKDHPSADRSDPQLQSLAETEREAVGVLSNASDSLNQATTAVAQGGGGHTTLRVIDAPQLPVGPTAGKKKILVTVAGGGFAGAVVSILGIVALARRQKGVEEGPADEAETETEPDAEALGARPMPLATRRLARRYQKVD